MSKLRWYDNAYWLDVDETPNSQPMPGDRPLAHITNYGPGRWRANIDLPLSEGDWVEFDSREAARAAVEAYWTVPRVMKLRLLA